MTTGYDSTGVQRCDLLVVGSGAGGMSAAVTASWEGLKVIVVEKEAVIGGASARSGGCPDSREAAETYIRYHAGDRYDPERVEAFLDEGPEMVDFFRRNALVQFNALAGFPDYYPDHPGGVESGRSIYAANFDGRKLGHDLKLLRRWLTDVSFMSYQVGTEDVALFLSAGRKPGSFLYVARQMLAMIPDLLYYGRSTRLTGGNALIAALLAAAHRQGVVIHTSSPARSLLVENGWVRGAVIEQNGRQVRIEAAKGVVLASGGFPHDSARRAALFPRGAKRAEAWGMLPYGNTGDGIDMGEAAGGYCDERMPMPVALTPIQRIHVGEGRFGTFPVFMGRAAPGVIAVTANGKRFVNEARSYHEFGKAMLAACAGEEAAVAYCLCDYRALRRYGLGRSLPFPMPVGHHVRSGELKRGRTIRELALAAGIDASALEATVAEYNRHARHGEDPEFGRGTNAYDRVNGDPDHKPNPNVAPLDKPPFYAIRVVAGSVGTFAGLMTNARAQVVHRLGWPIRGLYAAGNDLASITGGDYVGGGCTIGPAMTFGYIAARHAAGIQA